VNVLLQLIAPVSKAVLAELVALSVELPVLSVKHLIEVSVTVTPVLL